MNSEPIRGIFADVETGGFNEGTDALMSVSLQAFQQKADKLVPVGDGITRIVIPAPHLKICYTALEVQGLNWHSVGSHDTFGDTEASVHSQLCEYIGKTMERFDIPTNFPYSWFWAHNAVFDWGFLSQLDRRVTGKTDVFGGRNGFSCTKTLLHTLHGVGRATEIKSSALQNIVEHFGIRQPQWTPHQSRSDAMAGIAVAEKLLQIAGWLPGPKGVYTNG